MEHYLGAVVNIIEEEEVEFERLMMAIARVAADEIMELEGEGLEPVSEWEPVTVFINEYHAFGDSCFKLHFRMSRGVFEVLVQHVHDHLIQRGRLRRERKPFQDILLMVPWILATPDTFRSVALRFGVRPSTLHYFYSYVVEALREMAPQFIVWPNCEERLEIRNSFQRATGFPGIVGCIDCTHVYITAPTEHAAQYINRHHTYSLNVQAVVDHNLLIRDLHVGEVGSMQDRRVFRRSPLHQRLLQRDGVLSPDEHIVGDGGYTHTDFLMIPFENNGHLTELQLNYNKRLSQSRVRVEQAFGRGKGKWRRMKHLHARNQSYVVDHITASFVLHNFVVRHAEPMLEEEELARPIQPQQVLGIHDFHNGIEDGNEGDIENNNEELEQELEGAKARGAEKRLFIMEHVLPMLQVEIPV